MKYRTDKHGDEISNLGFGCMRFPQKGGAIDVEETERQLLRAVELGVNYFDTAYIYSGSETVLGEIVEKNNLRSQIKIATKLPQYLILKKEGINFYFDRQLKRLRTDYIDYYLMHMLTDLAAWEKLCDLGIKQWIDDKKSRGVIKNIGFSFHGDTETFLEILEAYDWDFCQIQYNYLDEHSQAGRRGLERAYEKGIPVIIMEPLRGGRLVNLLPETAKELIRNDIKGRTPAEISLRWLWNQPGVTCVLSGMNSMEMLEENCRIASEVSVGEFTSEDFKLVAAIGEEIQKTVPVPCTGCSYCMPCPRGVDIPAAFRCYNRMYTESKKAGRKEYYQTVSLRKEDHSPGQCVGCGKCESHCPQHISIIEELKKANKALQPPYLKAVSGVARLFVTGGRR